MVICPKQANNRLIPKVFQQASHLSLEKALLDQLSGLESARVAVLARKLTVTEETIRRLAKKLDALG